MAVSVSAVPGDRLAVGVDVGASNLRLVLVGADGIVRTSHRTRIPSPPEPPRVVAATVEAIRRLRQSAVAHGGEIAAVGLGVAGLTDPRTGFIHEAPNLGWRGVPFGAECRRALDLPLAVENDANAAAFGEWWAGAGRGSSSLVGLTLGTGVGGGIVLDGALWRGCSGMAAELGHLIVEADGDRCPCGARGCLEAYAAGRALERYVAARLERGGEAFARVRAGGGPLTGSVISAAARAGDPLALEAYARFGRYLGIGLASLINALNPAVIVLGGGLAEAAEFFRDAAEAEVRARAFAPLRESTRILVTTLGDLAGAVGAAGLALRAPVGG